MKHKANRLNQSATAVSYVGAGFKTGNANIPINVGANGRSPLQKDLHEGWVVVPLSEVAEINPKFDKSKIADNTIVSFVPMQAVGAGNNRIDTSIKKHFADVKKGYTPFQTHDVLFAKITPCMENGKIVVVPALHNNLGFGSTEFHVIRPKNRLDPRYIYYYVSRLDYRKEAASKMNGAVGQKRVPTDFIKSSTIPLAPLDQQKLIVAEIEKQFSRLDEAVAALKRIQANLKRYKASVLKAAVEGKLTEEWRSRRGTLQRAPTQDETGTELLKRILAERKKKWEENYVKKYVGAHGHAPKDDSWKKKYKEPAVPDTSNLPELPKGWVWASFDQVSTRVTVGHVGPMKNEYVNSGIPFLRSQNVRENRFDSEGLKFISPEFHRKLKKSALQPGDIVVVRSGSVGVACVIPEVLKEANCSDLVIVKQPHGILPQFGAYYMNSIIKTRVAAKRVGVALTHFNTQSMAFMQIPVPPLSEQLKIIEEVESCASVAEEIEAVIEANLKRAERLWQAILKKAFSGHLSTQSLSYSKERAE